MAYKERSDKRDTKLTKGMRSAGSKYEDSVHDGERGPAEGNLGFSKYGVGDQANTEAEAGYEGERAVEAQLEAGAIEDHEKFSDPMKNGYTGFEK